MARKKIVLVIVEGPSDASALERHSNLGLCFLPSDQWCIGIKKSMIAHQSLINGIFRKLGGGNLIKFIFSLLPLNTPFCIIYI